MPTTRTMFCRASLPVLAALTVIGGSLDTAHPMTATASGAPVNVRFTLTNELPFARKAEPVVCGLPLARGFVRAADQLNLLDSEDRPVPVQMLTTSTYSDGTPRWVLLAYHADYVCRMHFRAGKREVRVFYTFHNPAAHNHLGNVWDLGTGGSVFMEDFSIVVHLAWGFGTSRVGVEGIADYIRWFLYEPETRGAEITGRSFARTRYDASYRVSGNFLNWVTKTYDRQLIAKLNAAAREGRYSEDLWEEHTGHTVQELGVEWKTALAKKLGVQSATSENSKINTLTDEEKKTGWKLPCCTIPLEAECSFGLDSHHPIISLQGIPSSVIVFRILHPMFRFSRVNKRE